MNNNYYDNINNNNDDDGDGDIIKRTKLSSGECGKSQISTGTSGINYKNTAKRKRQNIV